eukprot:TRINITY_DN105566_c0_g1_i1.p2 TRINITY_DN105566_c0_g1~~TRINITY_DN105566_c0_g1_i1.p2  ORF type:complete len:105 (+),score=20.18 TRINITY_DN105566_c0_g1_i1:43-357(+)
MTDVSLKTAEDFENQVQVLQQQIQQGQIELTNQTSRVQELEEQLATTRLELQKSQETAVAKLNEQKQFQQMKKLMQQKSQEVVKLKKRLGEYENAGIPKVEDDN